MDTKLATKQIRLNEWAGIIRDCNASSLTVNEYCSQHNLSRDAYYYWLRKVREAALQQAGFVELPAATAVSKSGPSAFSTQMIIRVGETELLVNQDSPDELVRRVLGIVNHA